MEWLQIFVMILGNAAWILPMFFWNRAESRADARHAEAKIEGMRAIIDAIREEMKDFHGRLCAIEERKAKIILEELLKK